LPGSPTRGRAQRLATLLKNAGIPAKLSGARQTNQNTIHADHCLPGDPATKELFEFVGEALKK
jgi:hypothetical protein